MAERTITVNELFSVYSFPRENFVGLAQRILRFKPVSELAVSLDLDFLVSLLGRLEEARERIAWRYIPVLHVVDFWDVMAVKDHNPKADKALSDHIDAVYTLALRIFKEKLGSVELPVKEKITLFGYVLKK